MNIAADITSAAARVKALFAEQQAHALQTPFPEYAQRMEALRALRKQISRYQDLLAEAVSADFGNRPHSETKMLDLMGSTLEINHILSHLKRWMKPQRRKLELLFMSNSLQLTYQPKGVVGIIVPWNFPVYLALGPLAAALAAGNRVILKLSEFAPQTNALLKRLLAEIFDENYVAVVGEELTDPNLFTSLPFNHLIFTGSPRVGRLVMAAAAQNLTPVTLELGGKSPAVVMPDYSMQDAALRIVHGKTANAGQTCVAPDYVLVPTARVLEFVQAAQAVYQRLMPAQGNVLDHTTIISENHKERLNALLDDAKSKGASVTACGSAEGRHLPLYVVTNTTPDMRLMQEEIFGPILPVLPYDSQDEVIKHIQAGTRPLALYCFSHDGRRRDHLLRSTHAGGVSINDWGWHAMNHDVPFGGVGNSGMGSYHGIEGFRELSHAKPVFKRQRFFPTQLFYPPYGKLLQRLTLWMFLGRADRTLR